MTHAIGRRVGAIACTCAVAAPIVVAPLARPSAASEATFLHPFAGT